MKKYCLFLIVGIFFSELPTLRAQESKKNFKIFTSASVTFTIPEGVNDINIQCWGAGGGGGFSYGGQGGSYVFGNLKVKKDDLITIVVGKGGTGQNGQREGSSGGESLVSYDDKSTGIKLSLIAKGGKGGAASGNGLWSLYPGFGIEPLDAKSNFIIYNGITGENGHPLTSSLSMIKDKIIQSIKAGRGGNAANTINTAGEGGFLLGEYIFSTLGLAYSNAISIINPVNGVIPGGGGGAFPEKQVRNSLGASGGDGLVIISY